jgi:hypothetical protein
VGVAGVVVGEAGDTEGAGAAGEESSPMAARIASSHACAASAVGAVCAAEVVAGAVAAAICAAVGCWRGEVPVTPPMGLTDMGLRERGRGRVTH